MQTCPRCHGTGREPDGLDVDGKSWPCGVCDGNHRMPRCADPECWHGPTTPGGGAPMTECNYVPVSSRICERGTSGCTVHHREAPGDGEPLREALESLMQRRGVAILEAVRAKDRGLGYQVGMLLGDIARIAGINDPSLPPVPLARLNKTDPPASTD